MNMRRVYVGLLLAGLAASVGAQTSTPQSPMGNGGQGAGGGMGPGGQRGEHRHRPPPPEAIAACQGMVSGSPCSFTGRENRALSGTCFAPPQAAGDNHPLACRPSRPGGPGGQGGQGRPQ
jgi:hypothetical protein